MTGVGPRLFLAAALAVNSATPAFATVDGAAPSLPIAAIAAAAARPAVCRMGDGIAVSGGRVVAARLFERMQGYAAEARTSGGLGKRFYEVSDAGDAPGAAGTLRWAVGQADRDGGGWIGFAPQLRRGSEIALRAPLRLAANVTIDGGCVAPLITAPPRGSILYVQRTQNVVLTRLRLAHQGPAIDGKAGGDCITVSHGTDRVWIAYNEFGHCTDGQVDITQSGIGAPMRVTVAHNYFHDHDKAMLISGDHCRDTRTQCDAVALTAAGPAEGVQATLQANVFIGTGQRHPRVSGHAFADVSGSVVAYRPYGRVSGGEGGSYGAFAANGGRILIRNSVYSALDPGRAERAVIAATPASPGAVRTDGLIALPATSTAVQSAAAMVAVPGYRLDPQPRFAGDTRRAAVCTADAAGPGGWERAPGPGCRTP